MKTLAVLAGLGAVATASAFGAPGFHAGECTSAWAVARVEVWIGKVGARLQHPPCWPPVEWISLGRPKRGAGFCASFPVVEFFGLCCLHGGVCDGGCGCRAPEWRNSDSVLSVILAGKLKVPDFDEVLMIHLGFSNQEKFSPYGFDGNEKHLFQLP
jgi:hypothetical protein